MRFLAILLIAIPLRAAAPPPLMLWAWERPGDLRSLPANTGVAFLAATVRLSDGKAEVIPRFQPLRLPPNVYRMAVVRIDAVGAVSRGLQPRQTVDAIADAVRITRVGAVQVDFDAPASLIPFYRELLTEARRRLPSGTFLSMTALVSWCGGNSWMRGLPVD